MKSKANPTLVGAFVLGSIVLTIAAVAVFGGGRFLAPKASFVIFFRGNVSGLQVGAPVSFRGVKIGSVRSVEAVIDPEQVDIHIKVTVEILGDVINTIDGPTDPTTQSIQQGIVFLVKARDMRAKLQSWSFVTGQLFVDLDFYPGTEATTTGLPSQYPEIPTIPSDMQQLRRAFTETMETLRELPLGEIMADVERAVEAVNDLIRSPELQSSIEGVDRLVNAPQIDSILQGLDDAVNGPELAGVLEGAHAAVNDTRSLIRGVEGRIRPLLDDFGATAATARSTLEEVQTMVATLERSVAGNVELHYQIRTTLDELSSAARSVRTLADYIERHPEALLRGKQVSP